MDAFRHKKIFFVKSELLTNFNVDIKLQDKNCECMLSLIICVAHCFGLNILRSSRNSNFNDPDAFDFPPLKL